MKTLEKFDDYNFLRLKDLSLNECNALFERHLISKELIENKDISGVAISEDEKIIVMINEEDHMRIQIFSSGLELENCLNLAVELDEKIGKLVTYAASEKYGYLTACPTNVGTGMRASVMVHLPALTMTGNIRKSFRSGKWCRNEYSWSIWRRK